MRVSKLNSIIGLYPQKADAYLIRGQQYLHENDYQSAIKDFRQAMSFGGDQQRCLLYIGHSYRNQKSFESALNYYDRALKLGESYRVYFHKGLCHLDNMKYQEALSEFTHTISFEANQFDAYLMRAVTLRKMAQEEDNFANKKMLNTKALADLSMVQDNNLANKYIDGILSKKNGQNTLIVFKASIMFDISSVLWSEKDFQRSINQSLTAAALCSDQKDKWFMVEIYNKVTSQLQRNLFTLDVHSIQSDALKYYVDHIIGKSFRHYYKHNYQMAERLFTILVSLNANDVYINLAYMKRRNECKITTESVHTLLNRANNKKSAIYCINAALCCLDGIECEKDFEKAKELLYSATDDFYDALEWWSDENTVGLKESNIVLYLIRIFQLTPFIDNIPLEMRRLRANQDGYSV